MMQRNQIQTRKRKKKTTTTIIPATTPTPTPTTTTTPLPDCCLPDDIIFFNILPKLPVRCLLRFNCVSKLWYKTIHDDPKFHASHLTHSKSNPSLVAIQRGARTNLISFLCLKEGNTNASLELDSGANTLVGTCNGITCFEIIDAIQISNPSTRELLSFPNPKPSTEMQRKARWQTGFGFDHLMNEYKVIHIWLDYHQYYDCMVFTLGTNKWRNITTTCNYQPSCYPVHIVPICISGTLLIWRTNMNRLLSFDLHHEKFQLIPFPQVPQGSTLHTLFELQGCPCLVYRRDDALAEEVQLTLYMLKDHPHLRLMHTNQQQQASSSSSSGTRWIKLRCSIRLPLKPDIKSTIGFVEFAKHIYLHWFTMDGHFILRDINKDRLIHNKLLGGGLETWQWGLLVNHVENLLSLKTFVPPSAGEVEVKYLSSRKAKHESLDHDQQGEMKKRRRRKIVFDSHGFYANPCWYSFNYYLD